MCFFFTIIHRQDKNTGARNAKRALKYFSELKTGTDGIAAHALFEMGHIYLSGDESYLGVRRNEKLSVQYFNQSALLGYGPALHMMSVVFSEGIGECKPVRLCLLYFICFMFYIKKVKPK